jgi:hypothetical protein
MTKERSLVEALVQAIFPTSSCTVSVGKREERHVAENARRRLLDITVESQQLSHATRGMPLKFILFIGRIAQRTLGSRSRHRDARSGWIRPRKCLAKRHSRESEPRKLGRNQQLIVNSNEIQTLFPARTSEMPVRDPRERVLRKEIKENRSTCLFLSPACSFACSVTQVVTVQHFLQPGQNSSLEHRPSLSNAFTNTR